MNKFAKICAVTQLSGKKARFYSIQFEGHELNEIEDFFTRHEGEEHLSDELNEILTWIDGIAHQTGALVRFFRHEGMVSALPPENSIRKTHQKGFHVHFQEINKLRLYLIRLNEHVVFLLNGGEKTQRLPDKCPNVGQYFKQAQLVAKAIDNALKDSDIKYNNNKTDIIFSSDFELELL